MSNWCPKTLEAQTERGLLGSIVLDNSNWSNTADLSSTDFFLSSHAVIYGCMAVMFEDQRTVDSLSLAAELDRMGKLSLLVTTHIWLHLSVREPRSWMCLALRALDFVQPSQKSQISPSSEATFGGNLVIGGRWHHSVFAFCSPCHARRWKRCSGSRQYRRATENRGAMWATSRFPRSEDLVCVWRTIKQFGFAIWSVGAEFSE